MSTPPTGTEARAEAEAAGGEADDVAMLAEYVRAYSWQPLSQLLNKAGPARAEQLVNIVLDEPRDATALILCARASSLTPATSVTPTAASASVSAAVAGGGETRLGDHRHSVPDIEEPEGMLETCQLLVKHGADLNHRDRGGRTALHWAVGGRRPQLAALLLSLGADVGTTDNRGHTALHTAILVRAQPCVALLMQHDRQVLDEGDAHGTPPLTLAVQQGEVEVCRQLLEAGADVAAQEVATLRTPLHYALYLKHVEIFTLLLRYKPNLRVVDHRGTTVVHRCCAVAEPEYLHLVLASSGHHLADVINMADSEGATPLIIACQNDHAKQLQMLLDQGADVMAKDMHGRTALHHCVENADCACAELLLKADPSLLTSVDGEGLTPLHMAVIAGNVPLIRLLLKRGASLECRDFEDHTVAHWAIVCGHAAVLDVLLESGAEVSVADKHQAYPLHYAAQMLKAPAGGAEEGGSSGETSTGNVNNGSDSHNASGGGDDAGPGGGGGYTVLLRKLLDSKVSPEVRDKDGRTPIIWAASAGNGEACRMLVAAGADVGARDKDGLTAVHCAASRGHAECVRALVGACGAQVDPEDKNQCTPLFYATTLGHEACARALMELGARPDHTDSRGRTTAHCAAVKGSLSTLESLGAKGVDLWQPTEKGDYPIHEAAQAGYVELVEYLLQCRAGEPRAVDVANQDGRTCLHLTALTNNLWLAKFLLDHGADANAIMRNKGKNYTPYDAAVAKGNREAAEYLQSRGGKSAHSVQRPPSSKRPSSSRVRDRDRVIESERVKDTKNEEGGKAEELNGSVERPPGVGVEVRTATTADDKREALSNQESDKDEGRHRENDPDVAKDSQDKRKSRHSSSSSSSSSNSDEEDGTKRDNDSRIKDGSYANANGATEAAPSEKSPQEATTDLPRTERSSPPEDKVPSDSKFLSSPEKDKDSSSPSLQILSTPTKEKSSSSKENSPAKEKSPPSKKKSPSKVGAPYSSNEIQTPKKSLGSSERSLSSGSSDVGRQHRGKDGRRSRSPDRKSSHSRSGSHSGSRNHESRSRSSDSSRSSKSGVSTTSSGRKEFNDRKSARHPRLNEREVTEADETTLRSEKGTRSEAKTVAKADQRHETSHSKDSGEKRRPKEPEDRRKKESKQRKPSPKAAARDSRKDTKRRSSSKEKGKDQSPSQRWRKDKENKEARRREDSGQRSPHDRDQSQRKEREKRDKRSSRHTGDFVPKTGASGKAEGGKGKHKQQKQKAKEQMTSVLSSGSRSRSSSKSSSRNSSRSRKSSKSQGRSRSRSSSRSGSKSHSRSRSRSRSRSDSMGSSSSRSGSEDGEGLNLFSENEDHADHTDDVKEGSQDPGEAEKTPGPSDRSGQGEQQQQQYRQRPRSSRLMAEVQGSVRRFEQARRSIRQLQQLRRAQIYSSHARNLALYRSLLYSAGTPRPGGQGRGHSSGSGTSTWEQIMQEAEQEDKNKRNNDTKTGKRHRSAVSDTDRDKKSQTTQQHQPHQYHQQHQQQHNITSARGLSPERKKPVTDSGEPLPSYRLLQKQRAEEMHRLLLKAYRPALPPSLFLNGKLHDGDESSPGGRGRGIRSAPAHRSGSPPAAHQHFPAASLTPRSSQGRPATNRADQPHLVDGANPRVRGRATSPTSDQTSTTTSTTTITTTKTLRASTSPSRSRSRPATTFSATTPNITTTSAKTAGARSARGSTGGGGHGQGRVQGQGQGQGQDQEPGGGPSHGVSQAQYRAVHRTLTIMTPLGSRSVRDAEGEQHRSTATAGRPVTSQQHPNGTANPQSAHRGKAS